MEQDKILTIGHSTHAYGRFLDLLRSAQVAAVADVRTAPHSRRFPHFNRARLDAALANDAVAYMFLGAELGGRPQDRSLYTDGVADYERMAQTAAFAHGLDRVCESARTARTALMCAERDPLDCHRCLLVARALVERGHGVGHILADGQILAHTTIEDKLLTLTRQSADDLFVTRAERLNAAYRDRARKIAFTTSGNRQ